MDGWERQLADALEEDLRRESGILRGASLATTRPGEWHLLLQDPFNGTKVRLLDAGNGNFYLHVCCPKRRHEFMSHNRNAKMGEMRTACFLRVEQILNAVKIAGAPVTVTRLKKTLTIGKERNCSAVCMMLHFPVYQSSLKTTCNHAYPKRRKTAQTTGSVDYFHPGKKLSCTKSNLPMELLRNVGGNSSLDPLENERGAAAILRTLDGVKQVVRRNAEVVRTFAERLQENFLAGSLLSGADVMHAGSAYEGLSVKPKTDFDVIVVLALQELAGGFEVGRQTRDSTDGGHLCMTDKRQHGWRATLHGRQGTTRMEGIFA